MDDGRTASVILAILLLWQAIFQRRRSSPLFWYFLKEPHQFAFLNFACDSDFYWEEAMQKWLSDRNSSMHVAVRITFIALIETFQRKIERGGNQQRKLRGFSVYNREKSWRMNLTSTIPPNTKSH